jgi:hypothetical protein
VLEPFVLFPSHGGHRLESSSKVEFRASSRALRRYGDEGADQTVRPGVLVRPLFWGWTWIWTRTTDCLVAVRPIYQSQTSMGRASVG